MCGTVLPLQILISPLEIRKYGCVF